MRMLGIDYGEKRIGLAYGDELGLAYPLPAAVESASEARWAHIAQVIRQRRIDTLVVGYPYHMDGSVSEKAREVDGFIAQLEDKFALPVIRTDERLTSVAAENIGGKKKPKSVKQRQQARRSGETDSRAATIFLQDYLDQMVLLPPPDFEED